MSAIPIYGLYTDNILLGAVITSTVAPSTGYGLVTLGTCNPAARVRFGVTSLTVTFTIASALGQVLVIPWHNFTPGSSTVLTLTNGAGFSHVIPIPALLANGMPGVIAVDLTAFAGTLTSTVWNLVIASNVANVQLGGAVAIYTKRTFASLTATNEFSFDFAETETQNIIETSNEYGTPYIQDYGTVNRSVQTSVAVKVAGRTAFLNFYRTNHGRGLPGLLWLDPSLTDSAYFGRWQKTITMRKITPTSWVITVIFDEWPRGMVMA